MNQQELIQRLVRPLPTPAAGAELSIKPTGLGDWLLLNLLFTLTTSVAVPTRQVQLIVDDGTTTVWTFKVNNAQGASLAVTHQFTANSPGQGITGNFIQVQAPLEGIYIRKGWTLRSVTSALDVADQYSLVSGYIQEFPDGPDWRADPTIASYEQLLDA